MSGLLADVERRIASVTQLDAVVNAMRGIAGARAHQARQMLPAIRTYAQTIGHAIAQVDRLQDQYDKGEPDRAPRRPPALVLFGAEQGFAGAYPERVLDAAAADWAGARVFLVGARSGALADQRGLSPVWRGSLPARAAALPDLATLILDALYDDLAKEGSAVLTVLFPFWAPGQGLEIVHRQLLPLDVRQLTAATSGPPPLTNVPATRLLPRLVQDYVFAQLCAAAAEAFAAENEARMTTMAAARTHIDGKLAELQVEQRLIRQGEITAEVVELAAGARFHARR